MESLQGKSILNGVAIGKIKYYSKVQQMVTIKHVKDKMAELERYYQAREKAIFQLHELYNKAVSEVGEMSAEIFEMHGMMLEDSDYVESVENMISNQGVNAEYAVAKTGDNLAQIFAGMEDNDYMQARAADVRDISERLINILNRTEVKNNDIDEPVILMAEDLTPSETVQLDKKKLLGFITRLGSTNSHTAILARSMEKPALVGVEINQEWDGKMAIIDGYNHTVYIDPDQDTMEYFQGKRQNDLKMKLMLQELKGKDDSTIDGKKIKLYANIGNANEVGAVLANDAKGIGLFRSEFLYLESDDFPSEEEQFQVYKRVAESMAGKKVIIRTLDIGADKQADYFNIEQEDNPALGYRAIRICLSQPEIFKTQLRALFRASAFGKIAIMFPMIISEEEVDEIMAIVEDIKGELREIGYPFDENMELGIMIETPAAVLISEELAKKVDFFSIGTNDLTQYTLAIDRQNSKLDKFYNAHHPAILKMIQMTIENGHKHGAWVGICGELGSDTELTEAFLRMGIDELSVSPVSVLPVRKTIRNVDLSK